MAQTFTSAATSINSTKLPRVYRHVKPAPGSVVLDYGCGRYTDHIRSALPEDVKYLPWDPYNQPGHVNKATAMLLWRYVNAGRPLTVVCSNVLNVIDDENTVASIADDLATVAIRSGGTVYVTVYEGDGSGVGRQTGPDQWQRNEKLRSYLRYFPESARIRSGMIVYEGRQET